MNVMPREIKDHIIIFLDCPSLLSCSRVDKCLNRLTKLRRNYMKTLFSKFFNTTFFIKINLDTSLDILFPNINDRVVRHISYRMENKKVTEDKLRLRFYRLPTKEEIIALINCINTLSFRCWLTDSAIISDLSITKKERMLIYLLTLYDIL